jgi:predicted neuraminidase
MMTRQFFLQWIATVAMAAAICVNAAETGSVVVRNEFIFEQAPFRSCHASTIVETHAGLLAAWFGGTDEGALDVGIWISRHDGQAWSAPVEVANGADEAKRIRYPCWNPVLFQPKKGPLLLFYKVGPSPETWWGMLKTSDNHGRTWSAAKRLPQEIYGPIKNKPVELEDNLLICGSSTENAGWRVHMESTRSFGQFWSRTSAVNSALEYGAIQPAILAYPGGRLQILCRTKQRKITECWSDDRGQTWSRMAATELPNPNSGIDAVSLRDGRALLIYNHTSYGRGVLNAAISPDGKRWYAGPVLENESGSEFSYPAVIQTSDGKVHVTYTWKRQRIKHAVIDPFKLGAMQEIVEGRWP